MFSITVQSIKEHTEENTEMSHLLNVKIEFSDKAREIFNNSNQINFCECTTKKKENSALKRFIKML